MKAVMCPLHSTTAHTDSVFRADSKDWVNWVAVGHVEGFPVGRLSSRGPDYPCSSELPVVGCFQVGFKLSIGEQSGWSLIRACLDFQLFCVTTERRHGGVALLPESISVWKSQRKCLLLFFSVLGTEPGTSHKGPSQTRSSILRWVRTWFVVVDIEFGPQERQAEWGRWSILMSIPPSADFVMVVYFLNVVCVCVFACVWDVYVSLCVQASSGHPCCLNCCPL